MASWLSDSSSQGSASRSEASPPNLDTNWLSQSDCESDSDGPSPNVNIDIDEAPAAPEGIIDIDSTNLGLQLAPVAAPAGSSGEIVAMQIATDIGKRDSNWLELDDEPEPQQTVANPGLYQALTLSSHLSPTELTLRASPTASPTMSQTLVFKRQHGVMLARSGCFARERKLRIAAANDRLVRDEIIREFNQLIRQRAVKRGAAIRMLKKQPRVGSCKTLSVQKSGKHINTVGKKHTLLPQSSLSIATFNGSLSCCARVNKVAESTVKWHKLLAAAAYLTVQRVAGEYISGAFRNIVRRRRTETHNEKKRSFAQASQCDPST